MIDHAKNGVGSCYCTVRTKCPLGGVAERVQGASRPPQGKHFLPPQQQTNTGSAAGDLRIYHLP